jgi:exonuclease III
MSLACLSVATLYTDDSGRLIGLGFTKNNHKFYVIGAYAPCVIATIARRKTNATFLNKFQALMLEKRAEGYNIHAAGDLNFIRSMSLEGIRRSTRIKLTGSKI